MAPKRPNEKIKDEHFPLLEEVVEEAAAVGVKKIVNVGTSVAETYNSIRVAQHFDNVWSTAGIHPCDCSQDWYQDFKKLEALVRDKEKNKIVGIGETGLDFFHKPFFKERQQNAFKAHIECAIENDLALVVHVREAADDVLEILENYHHELRGVIHCFLQSQAVADTVTEWGFYIGIDAPITYPKNQWLRDVVNHVSLDHIILETDSPFLPPQQMRGKKNAPQFLPIHAQTIAEIKEVPLERVSEITTRNAEKLFRI